MPFKENDCIAYQPKTKVFCPVNQGRLYLVNQRENASLALLPASAQTEFLLHSNQQVLGTVAFNKKNRLKIAF